MSDRTDNTIEIGNGVQVTSKDNLKKRLLVALLVLCVIGICVAGFIYYTFNTSEISTVSKDYLGQNYSESKIAHTSRQPILLDDVLNGKYSARRNNASWISDSMLLYRDSVGNILTYDVLTSETIILADANLPAIVKSFSREISPDHRYLLLGRDRQQIFRHSILAHYDILDLKTKELYKLSEDLLALAKWGPSGNSLLYIKNNNIYYQPSIEQTVIQITNDGNANTYNGICDWVYEEEIFSTKIATWISPDNKQLAYIQFDDNFVNHISIPIYGTPGSVQSQYPGTLDFAYPKVGTKNPLVKLFLVDLTTASNNEIVKKVQILPPKEFREKEHIISVVTWANNETLLLSWMNRVQNQAIVETCKGQSCQRILNLNSASGWVEFNQPPKFNKNGMQFVYITPQFQKDANDSYQHLMLVSVDTGKQTALTSGKFVVLSVLYWNEDTDTIFYSANKEGASYIKHIWCVQVSDPNIKQCLTCNIIQNYVLQTYFTAAFSPNAKHVVITNDGPSIPSVKIARLSGNQKLEFFLDWENNNGLHSLLTNKATPIIKYHKISLTSGFAASVKLMLPADVDTSGKTKYPMLIDVYAGPGSFKTADTFDINFNAYLVSSRKYIVAQIDGRGSNYRGEKLLHSIYRALGTVEIEDQLETAKKLSEVFTFVDASNIAIWGWSYGGYAAGMTLAQDNSHVLKCAVSIAPVTDWLYYDTMYTERYMGLPTKEDNALGYGTARLSTKADEFRNKTYLLIHGTFDDNVHYQQSMALARTLELNDIPFEQIAYPDENHSLAHVRKHLYHAVDKFFVKCLTN